LARLTGQVLRYVAELDGQWVCVAGFGSAALSCAARDKFVGWSRQQQYARLIHVANNQRLCVLPAGRRVNLASAVLAGCCAASAMTTARCTGTGSSWWKRSPTPHGTPARATRLRTSVRSAPPWLPPQVGPRRAGCLEVGACMTGCRRNAKNSLVKNYL